MVDLLKYSVGIVLALLAVMVGLFAYVCVRVDRQGAVDEARPADAIVVLGARVLPDGRPSEDLLVRTNHGVDLYHRGLAPLLVCTGGYDGDRMAAAAVARRVALAAGVPEDRILLADGSMTTQEDAVQAARVLQERGLNDAIVVSHPLHLFRARLLFEQQGLTVRTSPTNSDLSAIRPDWRIGYDVREALIVVWTGIERWGLPRSWGKSLQHRLYDLAGATGE